MHDHLNLETILDKIQDPNERAYLDRLLSRDELTGAFNRRRYNKDIQEAVETADRANSDVSLLYIDIDHFKKYNDSFGHPAGDLLLQAIVKIMIGHLDIKDKVYRIGGEEFAVIVPETNTNAGEEIADRLRAAVENETAQMTLNDSARYGRAVTISVGVSNYKGTCDNLHDFNSFADRALYDAKAKRNTVCIYGESSHAPVADLIQHEQ